MGRQNNLQIRHKCFCHCSNCWNKTYNQPSSLRVLHQCAYGVLLGICTVDIVQGASRSIKWFHRRWNVHVLHSRRIRLNDCVRISQTFYNIIFRLISFSRSPRDPRKRSKELSLVPLLTTKKCSSKSCWLILRSKQTTRSSKSTNSLSPPVLQFSAQCSQTIRKRMAR